MKPFLNISRQKVAFLILGVLVLGGGFALIHILQHQGHAAHQEKGVYYCPMHPTYTSDRPGNCPICNMKLVKLETQPLKSKGATAKPPGDICTLHNCPRLHEGRPCPMMVVSKPGEAVTCPICGTHVVEPESHAVKKILYWTDPMMPGYKSDKPGKSPMGMDLVPVYEEAAGETTGSTTAGYAPILVSPQKQQLIGVRTAPAEKRRMTKIIRTVGRVAVDETRVVHVHPKVEGWIQEIYARYEGDAVRKGQPLFSFYSPDFISVQQEYLSALRTLREIPSEASQQIRIATEANVAAARQRLLWWDVTEEQIQALEKRGFPEKTLLLTSPIDGIVLKKHVWAGEYMERGADFFHLVDLSTLRVDADLYEYDLPLVTVGQEAVVSLPNDPQHPFRGRVVYVAPFLKPETRTTTARLEFRNPEGILRPDMFTNVEMRVELGDRLAVAAEAILDTGSRRIVFVDKSQGVFEPREIIIGVKANGYVEVKEGVTERELVVTSGNFLIDSESRLKSALEGMTPSTGSEQAGEPHQHGQ